MKDKLRFLPLLLLYIFIIFIVLKVPSGVFNADEARYVMFANNLSHGFYSAPDPDKINLWNGPGYPIVLLPFVLLKLPWITAKLLNALFLFGAVLYFYHTLRLYIQERPALYFSYLLGIYPPMMREVYMLMTESLTFFLIAGFSFYFCKLHHDNKNRWTSLLIASGFLGFLALTRVIFGYVALAGLLLSLFLYLWKKGAALKKTLLVYSFALFLCLPYLFYTYSLTGRIFYWGNTGGIMLYWLSTPYENESGNAVCVICEEKFSLIPQLAENHQDFYNRVSRLNSIQRDDEYKKQAIYNIRHHPQKFLENWIANISRLLFDYPYSYSVQRFNFYIVPNIFIVTFFVLCIYPAYRGRKLIPYEIYMLLLFGLLAFAGNSLGGAIPRYAYVLVPVFALWIFFTLTRVLKIELRK